MATSRALSDESAAAGASTRATESLKYRLSCDQCQNTKVICGREKPSCRRCAQRGVSCVYSPLRRIGRPRKAIHGGIGFNDDDNEEEHDSSESVIRLSSTLSHDNSTSRGPSTTATIQEQEDVATADVQMIDSHPKISDANPQTATSHNFVSPSDSNDEYLPSTVDSWISDHELCVAPQLQPQENHVAADSNAPLHRSNLTSAQTPSYVLDSEPEVNCYVRILAQTTKLEQALARAKLAPPIDLVLEAERDFCALRFRLIKCTGHCRRPPRLGNAETDVEFSQDHAGTHVQPCLTSDRPVLLGLALLAERIVGILEDMFRLAAQSAHSMDKANDSLWYGTPGVQAGPSARRLQRSFRCNLTSPCIKPVVEASRDLRIGNFLVQGQAKSDALKRILKLRVDRMLGGLQVLKGAVGVIESARAERGQLMDGPLHWGGSRTLLGNMAETLLDDLVRRVESMQGAMVLL
ncbi:hypothetical protein Hte_008234 [Hypoxylon texense]